MVMKICCYLVRIFIGEMVLIDWYEILYDLVSMDLLLGEGVYLPIIVKVGQGFIEILTHENATFEHTGGKSLFQWIFHL